MMRDPIHDVRVALAAALADVMVPGMIAEVCEDVASRLPDYFREPPTPDLPAIRRRLIEIMRELHDTSRANVFSWLFRLVEQLGGAKELLAEFPHSAHSANGGDRGN